MANVELVDAEGKVKRAANGTNRPKILLCLFSYAGVNGRTIEPLLTEMLMMNQYGVKFVFYNVCDDALISRSRSKALSAALQENFDVCVMVDHDLEWEVGSIIALAMKAHERKACVSGIYSARAIGRGSASRPATEAKTFNAKTDELNEAEYLSGGFLAIPKVVAEEVLAAGLSVSAPADANAQLHPCAYNSGPIIWDFFRPICVPRTYEKPGLPSMKEAPYEYLSEDWAFSWRCRAANPNRPLYLWSLPWLLHWGDFPFTMATAFSGRGQVQQHDEGTVAVPGSSRVTL